MLPLGTIKALGKERDMYKFSELSIDKTAASHCADVRFGRVAISFVLQPKQGTAKASFPISKADGTEKKIESGHGPKNKDTERQLVFETLIVTLAKLHPDGLVPNVFEDSSGVVWKLDKTAAFWAHREGAFQVVKDKFGFDSLVPSGTK